MVVTEKLDGTNSQVFVSDDSSVVLAGSQTRWITPSDDNFGFARWVEEHKEELRVGLGPGSHFGEWWGSGIQRGYGLKNGERHFSLFNVKRWGDIATRPGCCTVVPRLYEGVFDTAEVDHILDNLNANGSVASPGFMNPEGVVVFHVPSGNLYKKTLDKHDGHKGDRS